MPKKDKKNAAEIGIVFPVDAKGGRSTTFAGKKIIATALRACEGGEVFAAKIEKEKNWRFGYNKHIKTLVEQSLTNPSAALSIAKAGLDYMHKSFEFVPAEGAQAISFQEAMAPDAHVDFEFKTGLIQGEGKKEGVSFRVPYNGGYSSSNQKPPKREHMLKDKTLKDQLLKWADLGVLEPDAGIAIGKVIDYFASGSNLNNCYFIIIGAGSAMGPFGKLLELGANVIALDIPGKWWAKTKRPAWSLWKRLIETAKTSPGKLYFPLSKEQDACKTDQDLYQSAGCDLMTQPRMICNWLLSVLHELPKDIHLMIGNYTYLDGGKHVKLTLAADAIISELRTKYPKMGVAFLCTPTDVHVIPSEVCIASEKNYGFHGIGWIIEKVVQVVSIGKILVKNKLPPVESPKGGKSFNLVDGLILAQGPNYAIAKRAQHWRAQLTFEEGAVASTRIAPSTATASVMHNRSFQYAYFGMPYFKPFEIFHQETTNAVMTALLIHDVIIPKSSKNPANRKYYNIDNTLELFRTESVHGGVWRAAYKMDSIGEFSAAVYFLGGPSFFPFVAMLIITLIIFLIGLVYIK